MKYYLGIDGGGTKTTAVVCTQDGKIIKTAVGASINYYSNPFDAARRNFAELIDKTGIHDYASTVIGMSALSDRADEQTALDFTREIIRADKLLMVSDVEIALRTAPGDTPRAVLICGTGSMSAAINKDGKLIHAGGWGYLLGDSGSGYAIALNAIRQALEALENGSSDPIIFEFTSFFDVHTPDEILKKFYDPPLSRDAIAAFCPRVFAVYNASPLARGVIDEQSQKAVTLAEAVLNRCPEGTPLYLTGGLLTGSELYARLVASHKELNAKILPQPPVFGALNMALQNDGIITNDTFYTTTE